MSTRVELWALTVVQAAGCVLLLGEAIDGDWARTALWALVVTLLAAALIRARNKDAVD